MNLEMLQQRATFQVEVEEGDVLSAMEEIEAKCGVQTLYRVVLIQENPERKLLTNLFESVEEFNAEAELALLEADAGDILIGFLTEHKKNGKNGPVPTTPAGNAGWGGGLNAPNKRKAPAEIAISSFKRNIVPGNHGGHGKNRLAKWVGKGGMNGSLGQAVTQNNQLKKKSGKGGAATVSCVRVLEQECLRHHSLHHITLLTSNLPSM